MAATADTRYVTFNYPGAEATFLTGIRQDKCGRSYISGFYTTAEGSFSFVYGQCRFWELAFPGEAVTTSLYGPCLLRSDRIRVVGNVSLLAGQTTGVMYEGPLDGSGKWTLISPEPEANSICHSTDGDLVVGNWQSKDEPTPHAFIYDVVTGHYTQVAFPADLSSVVVPELKSATAYGIRYSSRADLYTIAGGFDTKAYLVDYDVKTGTFSNVRLYSYRNRPEVVTHFNGIAVGADCGRYDLTGDSSEGAFIARSDTSSWRKLAFPGAVTTSGNSIAGNQVVGVYTDQAGKINGYRYFM